jgi:hypothetical protein
MYEQVKTKFQTVSRAAQMNLWYQFMNFTIDPNAPTAGIASKLNDIYTKLKAVKVRMSGDVFLGFVLQSAIMSSGAACARDFEQQVKLAIHQDPDSARPTFPQLITYFDICRQQHQHHIRQRSTPAALPSNDSALMVSTPDTQVDFDTSAYLADVDESEWADTLDFYAVAEHKCWHCGGENH